MCVCAFADGVEGNLVPIDGLEVIQQQQLEELKEMERRRESEASHQRQLLEVDGKGAKSTDEEVLTPVNNSDQDLVRVNVHVVNTCCGTHFYIPYLM